MSKAQIVGWAHSPFGKLEDCPDLESLMARVVRDAIADLQLPLYRLSTRLTSLDEVFLRRVTT